MPVMATVDRLLDQPTQVDSVEATEQGAQHHAGDDAEHDGTEAAALVSVGIKEGDTPITFDDRGRISPGKADEGSSGSGTDIEEPAKRPSGINLKRTMAKRSSMDMDAKRGRFVNGNPDVRETHIQNILQNCNTVQSLEGVIKNMKESAQKFDLMLEEKLKEMDNISTAKSLHLEVVERAQFRLTLMKSHVKSKPEVNGQHEQPIAEGRQGPIIPATDVIAKHRRNFPENADPPRKSRRPRQIPVREQASFELANHSTIPLPVINSTFSDKMILFAKEAQTKKLGVTVPVPATSSPAFSYSQNALNFSAHQASPQPESLLATYLTKSTEKAEHMESSLKRLLMDSKGRQSPRVEATDSSASSHFTDILASSKIPAEVTITNVTANHALTVPQRQSALNAKLERQGEDMDGKRLVIENSSTADNCKAAMLGRDAQNCQKCATNAALFECAGCYQARYCSRKCQEDDWERHSEDCMRPKKSVKLAAKTPTSKAP